MGDKRFKVERTDRLFCLAPGSLLGHFTHSFTFNPHSLNPSGNQDTSVGRRNEYRNRIGCQGKELQAPDFNESPQRWSGPNAASRQTGVPLET